MYIFFLFSFRLVPIGFFPATKALLCCRQCIIILYCVMMLRYFVHKLSIEYRVYGIWYMQCVLPQYLYYDVNDWIHFVCSYKYNNVMTMVSYCFNLSMLSLVFSERTNRSSMCILCMQVWPNEGVQICCVHIIHCWSFKEVASK